MPKSKTAENEEIIKSISNFFDRASVRFMWFVAGAFFGYLWMARAYGLF